MDRFLWTFSPGSKDVLKQLLDCYSIHIFLLENTMYLILEPNFCVILAIWWYNGFSKQNKKLLFFKIHSHIIILTSFEQVFGNSAKEKLPFNSVLKFPNCL